MFADRTSMHDRVSSSMLDLIFEIQASSCLRCFIGKCGYLFIINTQTSSSWIALVRLNYFRLVGHLTNELCNSISILFAQLGVFICLKKYELSATTILSTYFECA